MSRVCMYIGERTKYWQAWKKRKIAEAKYHIKQDVESEVINNNTLFITPG